jgi:hypothetical protein
MKDYSQYAHASVSMSKDQEFIDAIATLFRNNKIEYIVESGTYMGTGSTKTIADLVLQNKVPIKTLYTIEVDRKLFSKAIKNLRKYPFVTPIWGISVDPEEAIKFVNTDDAIQNHEKYPDVFIDTLNNPVQFYISELNGQLSQTSKPEGFFSKIFSNNVSPKESFEKNVFKRILLGVKECNPLILLDSAGGIGFLEFNTVLDYLKEKKFIIILDDIHHLKHFRSLAYIENSKNFTVLNKSPQHGWVIAMYKP